MSIMRRKSLSKNNKKLKLSLSDHYLNKLTRNKSTDEVEID